MQPVSLDKSKLVRVGLKSPALTSLKAPLLKTAETVANNKILKPITRLLIVFSSLLMVLAYFFPLWDIQLQAPQYPEGLGMQIWINKLGGDVAIINGLNHYIGMKNIEPEMFPELLYMPYIIGFLIAFGLLTALVNKRFMLLIFVALIVIIGTIGMVDFWLWEYDYGHNLDPRAAIIVPGMSYQPPLIGSKQLLNFTAISWPAIGGIAIFVSGIILAILAAYEVFRKRIAQ